LTAVESAARSDFAETFTHTIKDPIDFGEEGWVALHNEIHPTLSSLGLA
jgi:hypothetical protein